MLAHMVHAPQLIRYIAVCATWLSRPPIGLRHCYYVLTLATDRIHAKLALVGIQCVQQSARLPPFAFIAAKDMIPPLARLIARCSAELHQIFQRDSFPRRLDRFPTLPSPCPRIRSYLELYSLSTSCKPVRVPARNELQRLTLVSGRVEGDTIQLQCIFVYRMQATFQRSLSRAREHLGRS